MQKRPFGKTGMDVTVLGFGAAQLRSVTGMDGPISEKVLNGALDAGMNLIDTAECYGDSEVFIGNAVSHRRSEYYLVTKWGHKASQLTHTKWTVPLVRESIEASLARLKTDHVDALLMHSPADSALITDEIIEAMIEVKQAGLTRFIGYSGDGEDALAAIATGAFDCIETSVSIFDQQVLDDVLPAAAQANLGVIVKRPLANAIWRYGVPATGEINPYHQPYYDRFQAMDFTPAGAGFEGSWAELAIRFAAYAPGVSICIPGSTNPDHVLENIDHFNKGPLDRTVVDKLRQIWAGADDGSWMGQG